MQLIKKLDMRYATATSKQKSRYGLFLCPVCTTSCEVRIHSGLISESCKSCVNITHGGVGTRLYKTWSNIKQRCNNENHRSYKSHGGRGIKICDEWYDFAAFRGWAESNGYNDDLTIDRINNDGNYDPDNCRFTTQSVQQRNKRILIATNTSGYRGVFFDKSSSKWKAEITVNSKTIYLGRHKDKLEAAKAYDQYVIDNNLEHTTNGLIKKDEKRALQMSDLEDYLQGIRDCKDGIPHTEKSKPYNDGYSHQYEAEQRKTQKTITELYNGNRKLN